ncbi:hypothetical protein [Cohnella panacarvi]|uniref:hypothetical protein n=1 Tax=Cohnella panacarvi TaxID=400776 RepID=UPI00047AB648|nr:hypothetical protein [Cohnella panacarvi]
MNQVGFIIVDIVMIAVTCGALWRQRWIPFALYAIADALYLYEMLRHGAGTGLEDLSEFATLIVIVVPVYLVATLVWAFTRPRRR